MHAPRPQIRDICVELWLWHFVCALVLWFAHFVHHLPSHLLPFPPYPLFVQCDGCQEYFHGGSCLGCRDCLPCMGVVRYLEASWLGSQCGGPSIL